MSFITIGIDPGQHGGIVILDENGDPIFATNMPRVGDVYDYNTINAIFEEYSKVPSKVAIELVGFMGAETAKNISDLVHHAGVLYGLSIAHSLPIILAPPSVWKKKIGLPPIGISYAKKGETSEDRAVGQIHASHSPWSGDVSRNTVADNRGHLRSVDA